MRGHTTLRRAAALLLALSTRALGPQAAALAGGGAGCAAAAGGEVARLRCQLGEATERLDSAVKAKELAVKAKDAELAQNKALLKAALEAKDAELARKEAQLKAKDAELARKESLLQAMVEAKGADLGRMEALIEDPGNMSAPLGKQSAGAGQRVHGAAPRLRSDRDGGVEQEEARAHVRALTEWRLRVPDFRRHSRRPGRRLGDRWPETDPPSSTGARRHSHPTLRVVDGGHSQSVGLWGDDDPERDLAVPHGFGRWHHKDSGGRLMKEHHHGRLLLTTDLPSIIAGLPDNTTRISLPSMAIAGTLPADLGRLVDLEYLDLSGNHITGTLPGALESLTRLRLLNLRWNSLTGTLPNALCNMPSMVNLDLFSCQLEGSVPSCLGNLANLQILILSMNHFTGTMPQQLGNLAQLSALDLSSNRLSGTILPDLGKLTQLSSLGLSDNQFTGGVPQELASLVNLIYLFLDSNQLSGTIMPEFGKLTNLIMLTAYNNQFTGTLPKELGKLANLTYVALSYNQLSGTIPDEFGGMGNMLYCVLNGNQLSGTIPRSLGQWTRTSILLLDQNRLTGTLPLELGGLSQLRLLHVGANLLAGTVPDELVGRLLNLQELDLSGNNFSGTLPAQVGKLQALQSLAVQGNPRLTGTFPDTTNCTSLVRITAGGCSFTSAGAVGGSVQVLSFPGNGFAELPAPWVSLPAVTRLDLSDNRIAVWRPHGVLPYGTFNNGLYVCGVRPLEPRLRWPAIESVDLSGNPFGQATTARDFIWSFPYVTQLSELRAARCQLQGELPYEGPFFAVDMESTGGQGCNAVPPRRDGFPNLYSLDLSGNNLSSIMSQPPSRLQTAALQSNALVGLSDEWYSISGTLEVWRNPLLRAAVLPPSGKGGCPTEGAPTLQADPVGWAANPGDSFQCTSLCVGLEARYRHDSLLNASSLCRCLEGRQGAAMNCTGCPADTYSQAQGTFEMARACVPCPDGSSTYGAENATGTNQCKCPAGWYMQAPPAGPANETAAPACVRCRQKRFMDTVPGATQEKECACNASYEGLRAVLGVCGCADGSYMDHVARACKRCNAVAERCAWGSAVELSLQPPVVEASYWAAPVPEPGPDDEASNFSKHEIWRCFSRNTCRGDSVCASGRSGTACSLCEAGLYGGPDGPCHPCPSSPEQSRRALLYGLLIGPGATLAAHVALQSSAKARGLARGVASLGTSLKQSVKYLQMLGVLSAFHVSWPPLARQFLTDIPRITVALPQVAGVACLARRQSASLEMGFRWLLPVAGLGSACLSALLLVPVRRCCRNRRCHRFTHMSCWDVLRVCLWGLTLFFSTLLQFGTQVLTCTPSPHGQSTVLTFPHLECRGTGEWAALAGISAAFLLSFVVAVYLGVYAAWRRNTRALVDSAFQSGGWWAFLFDDFRSGCGHWVLLAMAKDTALVVIATAGASDGPSQLLATAAGGAVYSYAVLRDQPFRDPSNSALEAWTAMSMAVISIFAAGMGYPSSPNVADVAGLYPDGADNALYKRRERALLVLQWLTFAGPASVMLYQLLGMSDRAQRMVPSFLRPWRERERAEWREDVLRRLHLEAAPPDLRGVLERFDAVDTAKFRDLMSTSTATLGIIDGGAGGVSGLVRRRFAEAARSSESFQLARGNSSNCRGQKRADVGDAVAPADADVVAPADGEQPSADPEHRGNDLAGATGKQVESSVCPEVGRRNLVERATATQGDVVTL